MKKSGLKKLLTLILFVFMTVNSFATTYVISNYNFDVVGKTQKSVLANQIIPNGEERFSSEEELVNALEAKKQTLINKRLFKSVDYEYSLQEAENDTLYVNVLLKIVDAKTFLIVPYPKYDSNTGITINVKIRDKNMIGTFATLDSDIYALFRDGEWDKPDIFGELDVTNLIVGDTTFSIKLKANGSWNGPKPYYYVGTNVSHIPFFFNTWFDMSTYVEKNGEGNKIFLSTSYNGLKALEIGITPSITGEIYTVNPSANYFTPALSISNVNLWGVDIKLNSSLRFTGTPDSEFKTYRPVYFEQSIVSYFGCKILNGCSNATTIQHTPNSALNVLNCFNYPLSGSTTIHLSENVYMSNKGKVNYFDTGFGISQTMNIGDMFSITPKIIEYIRTTPTDTDPTFSRFYTVSATTSGNNINWKNNFREGFAYKIILDESWHVESSVQTANYARSHLSFTWFKIFNNWFNPSFRFTVNHQINKPDYGFIFGNTGSVGAEVRGVLNNRITDNNMFSMVANLNLLSVFPMPKLFDFADYYASVFFDYAIVKQNSESECEQYFGIGVEGIGILKEYLSYPIRLSIGIDLERLMLWLKDEGPSNFYEIFFGLDYFF